jgi:hypothetical protein
MMQDGNKIASPVFSDSLGFQTGIRYTSGGDRRVRFVPAAAKDTPGLLDDLCRSYREACENEGVPSLLLAATFVFDFLCIIRFVTFCANGR